MNRREATYEVEVGQYGRVLEVGERVIKARECSVRLLPW